jgi:hypothetical protein
MITTLKEWKQFKLNETVNDKSIQFPNCNLFLVGGGYDINGNSIVKIAFPNDRSFSIQTNGVLKNTNKLIRKDTKIEELSDNDIAKIGKEVCEYIKEFGTKNQKEKLKIYLSTNESSIYIETWYDNGKSQMIGSDGTTVLKSDIGNKALDNAIKTRINTLKSLAKIKPYLLDGDVVLKVVDKNNKIIKIKKIDLTD